MQSIRSTVRYRFASDKGSVPVFWTILLAGVVIIGLALLGDGGHAISARQEAAQAARESARAAQNALTIEEIQAGGARVPVTQSGASRAACGWASKSETKLGCAVSVRSDGTVDVTVTSSYRSSLLGTTFTISSSASARPAIGASQEVK